MSSNVGGYCTTSKGAKERKTRGMMNERLNELEELTRAPGAKKRSHIQTLHDVVALLTGDVPAFWISPENYRSVANLEEEEFKARKRIKEQNRRDVHVEFYDKLTKFILENNLISSDQSRKMTRLAILNVVLSVIKKRKEQGKQLIRKDHGPSPALSTNSSRSTVSNFSIESLLAPDFPTTPPTDSTNLNIQFFLIFQQFALSHVLNNNSS